MKQLDLSKTLYELTEEYPELTGILADIGFLGIKNPIARNTLGRMTTLPEGCKKQGKNLTEVIEKLKDKGFTVTGNW
ncbi:MAG: DUF1858 domain-containing protein [Planctomycetes bacterium]|nr:DUF1858 domain-containing protein [Planctomycetota bacterium]